MGKSLTLDGRYFRSNKVGRDYKSNVPTYYMSDRVGRDYNAELYDETVDPNQQQTPPSRLGSLAGTVGNAIGQTILEDVVPYIINNPSIFAQLFNMYKTAGYKMFRARKHDRGQEAFENNIPIAKEFIQNFWSLANLGRGLVRIESLYTVKKVGNKDEKPIYLEFWGDGDPRTLNELKGLGKYALQGDRQALEINAQYVRGKIERGENEETTLSGAYSEITDRDLEQKHIIDPTSLKPDFMPGDLFLTGQKGKRSVVYSSAAEGIEIVKYDKAGAIEHLTYRGKQDVIFTMIGFLYKLIDIKDFKPIAAQSIVQDQALQSTKATNRLYGKKRSDGIDNPIVGMA